MRASRPVLALLLLAAPAVADAPGGFTERTLASGLRRPVALAAAPDGTLYVGEQYTGEIRIWRGGQLLPTPFARVTPVHAGNNETGLLGLAVSPDYAQDRAVFVFVTATGGVQRVLRYVNQGDLGQGPTVVVDRLPTRGINHNGGALAFGPDGMLYVSVGDNADGSRAADRGDLAGKVLRYTPTGQVPADNPWPGSPVWAYGLRNTFRLAFQPGTGKLFGSENGPNQDDELNLIRRGLHHGWPDVTGQAHSSRWVDPLAVYTPTTAVVGLAFHDGRGGASALRGSLFLAHYKEGTIRRIELGGPQGETVTADAGFISRGGSVVDVVVGADGALYYCNLEGEVRRVSQDGASNLAPLAAFTVTPSSGGAPLVGDLDAASSSDLDGLVVAWSWDLGDGTTASGPTVVHTWSQPGNYTVELTVTDDRGATGRTTRGVDVSPSSGNPPPSAHIEDWTPQTGQAPLRIRFKGHGHDDGDVVEHRWEWGDGSAPEVIAAPGRDVNSEPEHEFTKGGQYDVKLTVVDDQGATGTHTRQIVVQGCGLARGARAGGAAPLLLLVLILGALRRPGAGARP